MTSNNMVQLSGYLGQEPKVIIKESKSFTVLQVATNDNYPTKEGSETKWIEKETAWHDVLVFRPAAAKFASALKKGDRVELSGSISYRVFKDEKGRNRKQAAIVANFVEKVGSPEQDELIKDEIGDIVGKMAVK